MSATAATKVSNTRVIAHNSMWYGLETGFLFLTTLVTSIAMARVIGPQKLGYFNYIMWLANMSGLLGSLGVPAATSKYMAEYLNRNELGIARAIFGMTMRLQSGMAVLITGGALALLFAIGDPQYRLVSFFQIASMLPSMLTFVPAQANAARENLRANAVASMIGTTIFTVSIVLSLLFGWNLLGIAIGILVYRTVELMVRVIPVWQWVSGLPKAELPKDIRKRMFAFSGNSIILMLLNIVVWDRSDVVLLKLLSKDISQITFFTVGFNLVEKAMILPQTFSLGVGVTVNAQYGRDSSRLNALVSSAARYLVLLSAPVLLGLAAISAPAIRIAYGREYIPAIPVLAVAALMALPKPLLGPPRQMLQANEMQRFLIVWGIACAVVNIAVDWMLIPHFGALGAAIGNGTAQMLAVVGPWIAVKRQFSIHLDYRSMMKIFASAGAMASVVVLLGRYMSGVTALVLAIPVGALIFGLGLKIFKAIQEEDVKRLLQLERSVPWRLRPGFLGLLRWISGARLQGA